MKQKKKLLSDIEKLNLLNKLVKINNISNQHRTNYHKYSTSSSKNKKNLKTLYLQKTNPSPFKPYYIKLIKKDIDRSSLSPNSLRNSNIEINNNYNNLNNSYDFIYQNKISKINELKNSLGNPKYARNMMINNDLKNYKYLSISTNPNRSLDNKHQRKYLLNSNIKHLRNKSYNYYPINALNEKDFFYTKSNNEELNNINNINNININLDNLTYIEGLLNDIIEKLYSNKNIIFDINAKSECFQFLKYYKQSSLFNKLFLFFSSNKNQLIIKSAINLHLFIILITYNLSSNQIILSKIIHLLKNIFYLLKTNLFLIIHQIELSNVDYNNDIHFQTCNFFLEQKGFYYLNENEKINLINNNCVSIVNIVKTILNIYQSTNNKHFFNLQNIFLNISRLTEQDIYNYFYSSIAIDNDNINNKYIIYQKEEEDENFIDKIIFSYKLNKAIPPFLKHKNKKRFTLVLDLEDTLLNIKMTDTGKLILNLRPGLISFLSGIKPYYEIISFSKFSKSYSKTIINYIQQGKKLFDANLYREHCTLIGRKFIKDISRIGRDMKSIIMVDDLPENLERFKSNGILILPYEGETQNKDRVLYELKKLLILFCRLEFNDIRLALQKYKDDIYQKITLGLNE